MPSPSHSSISENVFTTPYWQNVVGLVVNANMGFQNDYFFINPLKTH
jgi:hypothetical protein